MTEWSHFIKITIVLLLTSAVLVGSSRMAGVGVPAYNDYKEEVTLSNNTVDEYNNHIARRYPYNTIVSPLEVAYIATHYGISDYILEAFVLPTYNTHQIQIQTGTLNSDDMVDAYTHLNFLEEHATRPTQAWTMYSKYRVNYDRDPNTGEVSNLYFVGVER